jgi:hypothetical protein
MFHDPPHLQIRLNLRRELKFFMSLILSLFAPIYGAEKIDAIAENSHFDTKSF